MAKELPQLTTKLAAFAKGTATQEVKGEQVIWGQVKGGVAILWRECLHCICVGMLVYKYVFTCVHVCTHVFTCTCVSKSVHTCTVLVCVHTTCVCVLSCLISAKLVCIHKGCCQVARTVSQSKYAQLLFACVA